jgi:penicillin-binding protein 2
VRRRPQRLVLRDDTNFASWKIAFFQYVMAGVFLFLIISFWDLQILNSGFYLQRAERNRILSIPVPAPRGKILDRDGRVIVDSYSSFSLYLSREELKMEHLKPISEGLDMDYDSLAAHVGRFQSRGLPRVESIMIKDEYLSRTRSDSRPAAALSSERVGGACNRVRG